MNENGPRTSLSLLERVKNRDADAWRTLRDLYSPLVFLWCRWADIRDNDAADIGQEVFLSIARAIADFQKDQHGQTFRGWLRTITNNKIIDFRRRNQRTIVAQGGSDALRHLVQVAEPDDSADSLNESQLSEEKSLLHAKAMEILVDNFPTWYKDAFCMMVVDNKSPQEVAIALDRRVSAIYNAKARILKKFKDEFMGLIC